MTQKLGVVLVAYDSADVILDALETLLASARMDGVALQVVVVDNASPDDSVARIRDWAGGTQPYQAPDDLPFVWHGPVPKPLADGVVRIVTAPVNGGFAAGVNLGVQTLFADPSIGRVWVLNPDAIVAPGTVAAFARHDPGPFALMGGRVLYMTTPPRIQIDGGRIDWRTGATYNINQFAPADTPPPAPEALDFVMGASMVASREFWEQTGPMEEDYFLYYEEVDWALRRKDLPLVWCEGAVIYHRAGTAIGSPAPGKPASPFSLYFKHRARMMFLRRHARGPLVIGWAYGLSKMVQLLLKGYRAEAAAIWAGTRGARPPAEVRARLGQDVISRLFGA